MVLLGQPLEPPLVVVLGQQPPILTMLMTQVAQERPQEVPLVL